MALAPKLLQMIRARRALLGRRPPARKRLPAQAEPRRIEEFYFNRIMSYMRVADAMVRARIVPKAAAAMRTDSLNDDIDKLGEEFFKQILRPVDVEQFLGDVAQRTSDLQRRELGKQLGAGLGIDPLRNEPDLRARAAAFVNENVALIKSVPSKYFDDVEKLLTRMIAEGARAGEISEQLQERFGIAERSAALIARDQVGKYFGALNATRQQALGITRFVWRTSNDERVRPEHAALEGQTFEWDAPPPAEGIPGQAINCRCQAEPLLEDLLSEAPEPETKPEEETPPIAVAVARTAPAAPVLPELESFQAQGRPVRLEELPRGNGWDAAALAEAAKDLTLENQQKLIDGARAILAEIGVRPGIASRGLNEIRVEAAKPGNPGIAFMGWRGDMILTPAVEVELIRDLQGLAAQTLPAGSTSGLAVLLHEATHSVSPLRPEAYVGMAQIVEEVTTEMVARAAMSKVLGRPYLGGADGVGAYQPFVDFTLSAIQKASGIERGEAFDKLGAASIALRDRPGKPVYHAQDHVDALAKKLYPRAGKARNKFLEEFMKEEP